MEGTANHLDIGHHPKIYTFASEKSSVVKENCTISLQGIWASFHLKVLEMYEHFPTCSDQYFVSGTCMTTLGAV